MKRANLVWLAIFVLAAIYLVWRLLTGGMGLGYEAQLDGHRYPADSWDVLDGTARLSFWRTAGVWTAALFTLFVLSFVYKDNPFYKFAESVFIGVSAAYWMVVGFWTTIIPNLLGKLFPGWIQSWAMPGISPHHEDDFWFMYFVPLILGIMLLWRLAPTGTWIARWPLAFIIGTTAGIRLVGFIHADFLSQIRNTIIPLFATQTVDPETGRTIDIDSFSQALDHFDFWWSLKNLIIVIGVLACLVYFFFSFEHRGWVGRTARLGIWFLMITFGAAFGYTVMGRIALLAIRLEFLFDDWLWLIDPTQRRSVEVVSTLWPAAMSVLGLG